MAKVVFVNRFYWPDLSATSQILSDLAPRLAASGIEVHIVTSRLQSDRANATLPVRQIAGSVHIHRIWTSKFGRASLPGRALDYATFYLAAWWKLAWLLRRGDVVVANTDPPLVSIVAWIAAQWRGARLVNWLQDVFPEVATVLGANPLPRPIGSLVLRLRDRTLRAARANVVIGEAMRQFIAAKGVEEGRLTVIENWAIEAPAVPIPTTESRLRRELGPGVGFVVAYSGNFGRAHEFDTLLGAAELLRAEPGLLFLMVGAGARLEEVRKKVGAKGLGNVVFLPHQPVERLADSLAAADLHVVSLLPQLEGLIVPSKIYGVMAAGRPVLYLGAESGSIGRSVQAAGWGRAVAIGDSAGAARFITALLKQTDMGDAMGGLAHRLYQSAHGAQVAAEKWKLVLERVSHS